MPANSERPIRPRRSVRGPSTTLSALIVVGVACTGTGIGGAGSDATTTPLPAPTQIAPPPRVILDTDFGPDVDDVGALAMLHSLADRGEIELLAVTLSSHGEELPDAAVRAVAAVNNYYGRPDIPIGLVEAPAARFPSRYTKAVGDEYGGETVAPLPALSLIRSTLAQEQDASVVVVSVGFLTNLARLLGSAPDGASALDGAQLIAQKVRSTIIMGGMYPSSADHPRGAEFNFAIDAAAAREVVGRWPTPLIFVGWELGIRILTGAAIQVPDRPDNPVARAYALHTGGTPHPSFDLIAALLAARQDNPHFTYISGKNAVGQDGANTFEERPEGPHSYAVPTVAAEEIASVLDGLLAAPPTAAP